MRNERLVVYEDSYIPADARKMRWLQNEPSEDLFPELLQLMVASGFARADTLQASGAPKLRLHFGLSWTDFLGALRARSIADDALRTLVSDARQLFREPHASSSG